MNQTHEHMAGGQPGHSGHLAKPGRKWHRDWRIWAMVILMLIAMAVYVLTLDLR
jgi:hypothetical protein